MDEEQNPIKDHLFDYIKNSEAIPQLVAQKRYDKIINIVIADCYDVVTSMDEKDQVVGTLATGLLHYLLTNALITSQRKTEYDKVKIDIVIPDVKMLEKDPKKTLLIAIPRSSDPVQISKRISEIERIQPEKQNIWVVLSQDIPTGKKTFILAKEGNTFSSIIFEIAKFSNVGGTNKFKILRV